MELTVYEAERQIGALRIEPNGLYYDYTCDLPQAKGQVLRVFAGHGWKSEYLGVPDASGMLKGRLPKNRLPDGVSFAVAAATPRGRWLPWRGALDGVPIAEAFITTSADGIDLLLPPQEALKLPAWAENMRTETLCGREMLLLRLLPDGSLPEKMTDRGVQTDEETTCDTAADGVPADDAPDDGVGSERREADRADL